MFIFSVLQIDLRDDPKTITKLNDVKEKPIVTEQGQKLAKEVRHKKYKPKLDQSPQYLLVDLMLFFILLWLYSDTPTPTTLNPK